MFWVFLASAGIYLLLIGGLYFLAAEHVRQGIASQRVGAAAHDGVGKKNFSRARVVVPVTGSAPDLRFTLGSLLRQHHPNYEVVMVTRDEDDPASSVVRELCAEASHARHVLSGPAEGCGQKNHNLLRGISAAGARPEILVFCDANHWAPPLFLQNLVSSLEEGETVLASGYHRVRVEDVATESLGMLITVVAMHLLQGVPFITQPWGGATAVKVEAFETLGMQRIWAETVVDDYSLGCRFLKEGIRSKPVSGACLLTTVTGQTLAGWADWLTRQLMFLKCFEPYIWVAAIIVAVALVFPLLVAVLATLGGAAGWVSLPFALAATAFLMCFSGLALLYRSLVPEAFSLAHWMSAFVMMHLVAPWCYARTWRTRDISWRGITYRVGKGGIVEGIRMDDRR